MDAPRPKDKVSAGKNTRKLEKKRRKHDEKQKKVAPPQAKISKNAFEALDTAEEGDDMLDGEEGDGKQKRVIENLFWS